MPNKPLSSHDLLKTAILLKLPSFRGVFMRDRLPDQINNNESGIVNLDSLYGNGTHWVCYVKRGSIIKYFDSFGNLRPPVELQYYFHSAPHPVNISYNYLSKQKKNGVNCGHLCLNFLAEQR